MTTTRKFTPWTNEERALLAHLVGVAFKATRKKNVSEAVKFAAPKLGRSVAACAWQYGNCIKSGDYTPLSEQEANDALEEHKLHSEEIKEDVIDALPTPSLTEQSSWVSPLPNVQILEGSLNVQTVKTNNNVIIKIQDVVIIIS